MPVSQTTEKQGWKKKPPLVVHHQSVELLLSFHAIGMIRRIAQQIERHDDVHHGRIDGAQAVGVAGALQHPLLGLVDGVLADGLASRGSPRSFSILSMRKKHLRQLKLSRLRANSGWPPGEEQLLSLNPAGTGRRGFMECTMESGMTMARVQEDIW